jgi:mannose-1-phosphate guanylyltransferase/mannose-6-phosphate isomerase
MKIQPVILSGGSGTRLWPLSREAYPKQFHALIGDKTLFQETVQRLDGLLAAGGLDEGSEIAEVAEAIIVCNEGHRFLVAEQLQAIGRIAASIILEPVGRNTAPALTLAALAQMASGDDAVLVAMPADHLIRDREGFHRAVRLGVRLAERGRMITFGIVPDGPETGFGYIRKGPALDERAFCIAAFAEKPERETAEHYVRSGDYLWNSGIFLVRASFWLRELGRYRSEIVVACRRAYERVLADLDFMRVSREEFAACPRDSIDYALMERLEQDKGAVIPVEVGWSDVGAWSSLWQISPRDAEGNVSQGDTFLDGTRNTVLIAQHRLLAAVGVEDLIVVETPDAVLVAHRDRAQDVKAIVADLKANERPEFHHHRRVHRPWGNFEGIDNGERFQVKRLTVNPGASLSLQLHHHRAEHWIVVKGTARVSRGDKTFILSENQSTYIPLGTAHRLENPGTIPLEVIEVQSGSYLGEDDIVRFKDDYNRGVDSGG